MKKCFIIFSLLFIFFSCSDDPLISEQENYNSVEHAQKWFEQNVNISSPSNGRISSRPKNVSWENGISYVKDKTQTVEVPIQYETELIAYPQSINKNASYKNLTKLLMFDDGKGGYNIFVMRIMPDMGSVPELAMNTYDKKKNSFAGDIIYYTWEGKPLVHTRYENGKRVEWNYIEQTSKTEDTSGARTTNECYRIEVEWYSVTCSAYGCGEPTYLYSDYYYLCSGGSSPYTDEYADPGDLYGGGGGGSSGGVAESVNDPCKTSKEDLKKVFPNTSDSKLQEIAEALNEYGKDFGIDTKEKLQHFLAQAGHESAKFTAFEENLNYRWSKLGTDNYWTKYFNPVSDPTKDPDKQNPNDYKRSETSDYVDIEKFANYVYGSRMGNDATGDGYKYRGRGIFQLTGKSNYESFSNFYKGEYDSNANFVTNPDLVSTNMKVATISALWYFKNKVSDKLTINSETSVKDVTQKVNGGTNGLTDREEIHTKAKTNIDCL
jgi:putative chitinase